MDENTGAGQYTGTRKILQNAVMWTSFYSCACSALLPLPAGVVACTSALPNLFLDPTIQSKIWYYFTCTANSEGKLTDHKACLWICKLTQTQGGSTSNLVKHFADRHADLEEWQVSEWDRPMPSNINQTGASFILWQAKIVSEFNEPIKHNGKVNV